jgi:hypothetical protein
MTYATVPDAANAHPAATPLRGAEPTRMPYAVHARLKQESAWHVIARFTHDEDARVALWAVVFTCKYAEAQVRDDNSATPLAEWLEVGLRAGGHAGRR